jgi:hypothetical protein
LRLNIEPKVSHATGKSTGDESMLLPGVLLTPLFFAADPFLLQTAEPVGYHRPSGLMRAAADYLPAPPASGFCYGCLARAGLAGDGTAAF